MPEAELVSVIMPVYNASEFVTASVESILFQTHDEFELIAVDDGSTDNSYEILQDLERKDSRVRAFTKPNGGLSTALNLAISKSNGQFIARMDADDLSYRTRFEEQVNFLKSAENIALCSSAVDYTFFTGRVFPGGRKVRSPAEIKVLNLFSAVHVHPTVMFDARKIDREDLYYDEAYLVAEDYELFTRIGAKHETAILPDPKLLVRRQEHGNLTALLSKRIGSFHFQVTERECALAGIVDAQPGVMDILTSDRPIDEAAATILAKWLTPIANFDGYRNEQADAYRFALSDFFDVVIDSLIDRMPPALLKAFLDQCGMAEHLSRFNRLRLRFSHTGASEAAKLVEMARQVRRYLKSKPRSYLQDQLPSAALNGF